MPVELRVEAADAYARQLGDQGYAWVSSRFDDAEDAFDLARAVFQARHGPVGSAPLTVVGDFVLGPLDQDETRDFQTLHFDFGVPVDPKVDQDLARYTALHVPADFGSVSAVTRLVPLAPLLGQRSWPPVEQLRERLLAYGATHGAWDDGRGYTEGSLARLVEAAAGSPRLPSVKADPDFLCGMEFDTLSAERRFLEGHSLRLDTVQREVHLSPGELLMFDNLAMAHGRRGVRRPGELRQRVFGYRSLSPPAQLELREQVLAAFNRGRTTPPV